MTPEEALRSILRLIDGSDDVEDVQVLHISRSRRCLSRRDVYVVRHRSQTISEGIHKVRPRIAPEPFLSKVKSASENNVNICCRSSEEEPWYRSRNQCRLDPMDS
jgi:hypothetical protein